MKLRKGCSGIIIFLLIILSFCSKDKEMSNENIDGKAKVFRYIVPQSGLRLRKEPTLTAKRLALIPCGAQVVFVEEKGEEKVIDGAKGKWTKIIYNNISGWAFGAFLSDKK